ncbi:ankyrin repeat-containing protein ANK1 KNAG_0D02950 [Huiozyma naganishii CBS 8797]|uniref:Uncharacterized protein n=1 Tax=Huiozyma naganishii (strain ATCC MYA-139 / BCRC 22969 / CBS 8797 / KCTC 17520 / NBRC 10181 / NCYC 3082 / Yp74L-3) TaxID=1071383 RepID=J7S5W4_HUIN7|nr:hypothetical protein KNAG_0D02950 [Kazachstania naganishii CBS 8797]CCK70044.1 hypothetical protein KNAG_0D02950 [Kazachstania naganishii CBS 8797]
MSVKGASLSEQLLDASRRNNDDLLEQVFKQLDNDPGKIAELINTARDPMGNTALHLCCKYGSWEVLDKILDQEGDIEIDPRNELDGDTPLHLAVRYAMDEPEHGTFIANNLVEVGADARIKNNNNQKPVDLIHGDELDDLFDLLQGAELARDHPGAINEDEVELIDDDDNDDDE